MVYGGCLSYLGGEGSVLTHSTFIRNPYKRSIMKMCTKAGDGEVLFHMTIPLLVSRVFGSVVFEVKKRSPTTQLRLVSMYISIETVGNCFTFIMYSNF